jgi:Ca-activated chloride channel family protein
LEVNRADLETAGRHISQSSQAGWSAIDLGDLPAGRPVWCAGRFPRTGAGEIIFRTTAGKGQKLATCSSKPRPAVESRPVIRPLFGARRILGLEQLIHSGSHDVNERLRCLGYDPQNVLAKGTQKVYAENARNELQTALSGLLVEESLLYGLASAETAFVAVRSEPGKPVESAVVVGSAFPAGWSEEGVAVGAMLSMNTMMPSMHSLGPACAYYDSGAAGIALGMVASGFDPGIARAMPAAILREVHDVVPESALLFEGVPKFEDGRATLFDSTNTAANWDLPDPATFNFLNVEWFEGTSDPKMLDRGLCLLLYVEDLAAPRARVSLAEILRSGGKRPLNIRWRPGQGVRLVLVDPNGVWGSTAPTLRASLGVG